MQYLCTMNYKLKLHNFIFIFCILHLGVADNRSTIITFPNHGLAGETVKAALTFINIDFDVNVTITFSYSHLEHYIFVKNGESRLEDVRIPMSNRNSQVYSNTCKFILENQNEGYYFNLTKRVSIRNRHHSQQLKTIIQTDKPIYKPGERVKIRVMLMDNDLKPIQNPERRSTLYLSDRYYKTKTTLKRGHQGYLEYGLLEYTYDIPSYANIGTWRLQFKKFHKNRHFHRYFSFEIKKYVLPIFKVTVNGSVSNNSVEAVVCAKYTFDESVKGFATFSHDENLLLNLEDGCASFTVNLTDVKHYYTHVTITESGTGIKAKEKYYFPYINSIDPWNYMRYNVAIDSPSSMQLMNRRHKMSYPKVTVRNRASIEKIQGYSDNLKPNIPKYLRFRLTSKYEDNTVVLVYEFINTTYSFFENKTQTQSNVSTGLVTFRLDDVPANTEYIRVHVILNGQAQKVYIKLRRWTDESNRFLSIDDFKMNTGHSKCAAKLSFDLMYNQLYPQNDNITFHYQFVNGYNVVKMGSLNQVQYNTSSETEELTGNTVVSVKNIEIDLRGVSLYRKFWFVVYYVTGGRVVSDYVTISWDCQEHQVEFWSTIDTLKPGQLVKLNLKARHNSLCSVSMIDSSLNLLNAVPYRRTIRQRIDSLRNYLNSEIYRNTRNTIDSQYCIYEAETNDTETQSYKYYNYYQKYDSLSSFMSSTLHIITDLETVSIPCRPRFKREFRKYHSRQHRLLMFQSKMDGQGKKENRHTRDLFPETWLFDLYVLPSGRKTIGTRVPDTITKWTGNAVCMNQKYGIGVSDADIQLVTKLKFFVKVNLPYSLKVNEKIRIPVTLHNYEDKCVNVRLVMKSTKSLEVDRSQSMFCSCPGDTISTNFHVVALEQGSTQIYVRAMSVSNGSSCIGKEVLARHLRDYVKKTIIVKHEGKPIVSTISDYTCINGTKNDVMTIQIKHGDQEIATNSTTARISIVGNILGPTLGGLDQLINMPTGCGEQNLVAMVPSVYVLKYLQSMNKLPHLQILAKKYINAGYHAEFKYQHSDNSFSAFGERDQSGSTFLTAFVLLSFHEAKDYINDVDEQKLGQIAKWLTRLQLENGCYPTVGKLLHKGMKGGGQLLDAVNKTIDPMLTAYVAMALLKSGIPYKSKHVHEAMSCLVSHNTSDSYTLAMMAYNYILINDTYSHRDVMERLRNARVDEPGTTHWKWVANVDQVGEDGDGSGNSDGDESQTPENMAVSVEITSYVIMSLLHDKDDMSVFGRYLPVLRWLTSQRNENGGFISTQDTIMGLKALSIFAKFLNNKPNPLIDIYVNNNYLTNVNGNNSMQVMTTEIDNVEDTQQLNFRFQGEGCLFYQVHMQYYVIDMRDSGKSPSFTLETSAYSKVGKEDRSIINTCVSYTGKDEVSNMVLVEIEIQSGWEARHNHRSLNLLLKDNTLNLKLYEVMDGKVNFYFEELTSEEVCFEFEVMKTFDVEEVKESSVFIYDYYNKDEFMRKGYTIKQLINTE